MQTGILDKTRLMANILMILLVGLNIFFSIQYTENIKAQDNESEKQIQEDGERLKVSRFLKLFIDKVLSTNGTISFDDRVSLESDIRRLEDPALLEQWEKFVNSTDSEVAQESAVKLMSMLVGKML